MTPTLWGASSPLEQVAIVGIYGVALAVALFAAVVIVPVLWTEGLAWMRDALGPKDDVIDDLIAEKKAPAPIHLVK